eukprot:31241-Pelagococcus_subviridis.AAC.9
MERPRGGQIRQRRESRGGAKRRPRRLRRGGRPPSAERGRAAAQRRVEGYVAVQAVHGDEGAARRRVVHPAVQLSHRAGDHRGKRGRREAADAGRGRGVAHGAVFRLRAHRDAAGADQRRDRPREVRPLPTASRTTPFAWRAPFLKDFSRRHSSPALPIQHRGLPDVSPRRQLHLVHRRRHRDQRREERADGPHTDGARREGRVRGVPGRGLGPRGGGHREGRVFVQRAAVHGGEGAFYFHSGPHTTVFAWCTPILKDFTSRRFSPPNNPSLSTPDPMTPFKSASDAFQLHPARPSARRRVRGDRRRARREGDRESREADRGSARGRRGHHRGRQRQVRGLHRGFSRRRAE